MKSNISRRAIAGLTAFALYAMTIFTPALETRALASQNNLWSGTTGTISGLQLTNSFNGALDSVNTANSGPAAPTNQLSGSASLGNLWLNTTPPLRELQARSRSTRLTLSQIDSPLGLST